MLFSVYPALPSCQPDTSMSSSNKHELTRMRVIISRLNVPKSAEGEESGECSVPSRKGTYRKILRNNAIRQPTSGLVIIDRNNKWLLNQKAVFSGENSI